VANRRDLPACVAKRTVRRPRSGRTVEHSSVITEWSKVTSVAVTEGLPGTTTTSRVPSDTVTVGPGTLSLRVIEGVAVGAEHELWIARVDDGLPQPSDAAPIIRATAIKPAVRPGARRYVTRSRPAKCQNTHSQTRSYLTMCSVRPSAQRLPHTEDLLSSAES
jgi:hypothetical protein